MNSTSQQVADRQPGAQTGEVIHPDTRLGPVTLQVADLERSIRFYRDVVGLQEVGRAGESAALGVDGTPLLALRATPGARPSPARATGLYHVAILLPSAADLG